MLIPVTLFVSLAGIFSSLATARPTFNPDLTAPVFSSAQSAAFSPLAATTTPQTSTLAFWSSSWSPFKSKPLPLIIWHGLGDSAYSEGMLALKEELEEAFPGMYVHLVALGSNEAEDRNKGVFGNINEDIEKVCQDLQEIKGLKRDGKDGLYVDAMGFSQGGQFLRGLVQRCPVVKVRNLITFGSQHMGISDFPACSPSDFLCRLASGALRSGVYSDYAQSHIVTAQYYRNPSDRAAYDHYLEANHFIADINNEVKMNEAYKQRLGEVENFVMLQFSEDKTVVPKRSSWFESFPIANETEEIDGKLPETIPLRQSPVYLEDRVGLKGLDKRGGLLLEVCKGAHMQIDEACQLKVFGKYVGTAESSLPSSVRHLWHSYLYQVFSLSGPDGYPWFLQLAWFGMTLAGISLLVRLGAALGAVLAVKISSKSKEGQIRLP